MTTPAMKNMLDTAAGIASIATVLGVINTVIGILASTAALVWTGIRLYEWYKEKSANRK